MTTYRRHYRRTMRDGLGIAAYLFFLIAAIMWAYNTGGLRQ